MSLLYMYSILRGFGGRGTGQHMQGQPVGGVKRRVGRNCPNQRNRRRVTITFEFFSSSRILFIVLYVHFIQIFQVLYLYKKISYAKARGPNQEKSSLGQDLTPAPTVISHQTRASVCHPRFVWALISEYYI